MADASGVPVSDKGTQTVELDGSETINRARCRLVVVERAYYESTNEPVVAVESNYSRTLITDDQLYTRRVTVGEDWVPLDCGWLAGNVGMLKIQNKEGENLQVMPTAEERAAIDARVVELVGSDSVDNPAIQDPSDYSWLVLPTESFRGCPARGDRLMVRCRKGTARIVITVWPK